MYIFEIIILDRFFYLFILIKYINYILAIIDNCRQVLHLTKLYLRSYLTCYYSYDHPTDDGLITIVPFLETLAVADDVRPIIGKRFGNKE
ncbi:unnamed protein product [Brassica rapa]|uniref:Uncharacterized protein n=2 Tax=Brassica TaxID=3705 RepID=A0A3P6AM37_BRACM|nr:unnamed protein product [Brassica napus]CAG7894784.1 unnamed protein product [Brassica rapa]CDY43971.1 BnaA02g24490D [Brassica napus]VDC90825.1 unnamed protein product [Brassica rapa]